MNRFCYSDGARARLRIPVGELNDLAGSRRNLHLRGEQPRWIPGESFLLRERRSLWRRQGPGNYFTINLCPPVMDYLIYYYYLLLLLLLPPLLLLLLLLLHYLYARVPAPHSTAFNCTTASYEKENHRQQPPPYHTKASLSLSLSLSLCTTSIFTHQPAYVYIYVY